MGAERIGVGSKFEKGVTQIEVVEIRISRVFVSEKQVARATDVQVKLQRYAVVSGMGTVRSGQPFEVNYEEFMRQIKDWEEVTDASGVEKQGQG